MLYTINCPWRQSVIVNFSVIVTNLVHTKLQGQTLAVHKETCKGRQEMTWPFPGHIDRYLISSYCSRSSQKTANPTEETTTKTPSKSEHQPWIWWGNLDFRHTNSLNQSIHNCQTTPREILCSLRLTLTRRQPYNSQKSTLGASIVPQLLQWLLAMSASQIWALVQFLNTPLPTNAPGKAVRMAQVLRPLYPQGRSGRSS